ncbi:MULTISPECIES: hypothetical protein [Aequorivita]|uniref:Uncharacterized protein n=1 Tax=Aequorivita iocasae TaxID=2803865 RepID=A0ABX7DT42_9FLAO|nr:MULTISPECIES: hypothetical protein [Aequorivita]QQX77315.1 hypothetical protein JK629_03320 [Aequorivita iocasae]UCA56804.1 hypothetical protein LDL78_03340 [Aequorivita sp. F7]
MKKNLFLLAILICLQSFSQEKDKKNVSLDALLSDTQFSSDNPEMLEFVWWLPREFWEVSYAQDPTSSEEEFKELNNIFGDYELFGVIRGNIGHFGGITYHTEEAILKELTVHYKGENLMVVPEDEISADFMNFFMIIQPMIGNMLGQMGNNIHFVLYKSIRGNEVLPVDPLGNGELTIKLGDFERTVDLPLNSLLLEKKCNEDGKLYSGKYIFCPIHGKKLVNQ